MRHFIGVFAVAILLLVPGIASAQGISGSGHDRGGQICQNCHVPHNAKGVKLWFEDTVAVTQFSTIQKLCWSCHDGSGGTSIGSGTVFNSTLEQHKGITANGSSGDCDGCHDVHNQNPNGTGRFLYADIPQQDGTYCATCHDGSAPVAYSAANSVGGGDHTYTAATTNHWQLNGTFTCNQCHTIHGATPQTTPTTGLDNPILLADNESGTTYGDFCISCHNNVAPAEAVTGTGGVAASDVFNYAQAVGDLSETSHPTTTATAGGCDLCHDVHMPGEPNNIPHLLTTDNIDGAFCTSCHTGGGGPTIGTSHPYGVTPTSAAMNSGLTPALPWSDEINDDPADTRFTGLDYPDATQDLITCETCHSVHRLGVDGPLLREANDANELCGSCHPTNYGP